MYLDKPAFPIRFPVEEAVKKIEGLLKQKLWHDFKVAELKLVYQPYWLCNYDAYLEIESKEHASGKLVSDTVTGSVALNANTNKLSDEVAELSQSKDLVLQQEVSDEYQFEVKNPALNSEDAKNIVAVRLAAKLSLPKENIIVSGLKLVYLPIWTTFVTVAEGTYKVEIGAVNGKIISKEQVPEREKGWLEITDETLQELKQPGAWIKYTTDIGKSIASVTTQPATKSLLHNRTTQIVILAGILIIIVLWSLGLL